MPHSLPIPAARRPAKPRRPTLEALEDRLVPSTVAGNYSDGVWRYDTTAGWTHLSTMQAYSLDVDDAGNVFGFLYDFRNRANDGVWRWSSAGWQKLSDLNVLQMEVTAGGVLYGAFYNSDYTVPQGLWRWSPSTGWSRPTDLDCTYFEVSDSDAVFGKFKTGTAGTWRWTPQAGWSLLSQSQPNLLHTDDAGDLVATYGAEQIGSAAAGTWRWTPTGGWSRLSSSVGAYLVVSNNGAVYEDRGTAGLWYLGVGQFAFTRISDSDATWSIPVALPDGSLFYVYSTDAGSTYSGWYYNATTGWAKVVDDARDDIFAVGKDGDVYFASYNHGLRRWALGSGVSLLTARGIVNVLDSQRPGFSR